MICSKIRTVCCKLKWEFAGIGFFITGGFGKNMGAFGPEETK